MSYDGFQQKLLDDARGWRAKNGKKLPHLGRVIYSSRIIFWGALLAEFIIFFFVLFDAAKKPDEHGVWETSIIDGVIAFIIAFMAPVATFIASRRGWIALIGVFALVFIWSASVTGFVSNLGIALMIIETFGVENEFGELALKVALFALGMLLFTVFTVLAKVASVIHSRASREKILVEKILAIALQADKFESLRSEDGALVEILRLKQDIVDANRKVNIYQIAKGICISQWQERLKALMEPNPYKGREANSVFSKDREVLTALIDQVTNPQPHQRSLQ